MMAPMIEPIRPSGCTAPLSRSAPKISQPRKPPTNEPTIAQQDGAAGAHRVVAGEDRAGQEAGYEADDQQGDDEAEHGDRAVTQLGPHGAVEKRCIPELEGVVTRCQPPPEKGTSSLPPPKVTLKSGNPPFQIERLRCGAHERINSPL
jgi:hypothetical protein